MRRIALALVLALCFAAIGCRTPVSDDVFTEGPVKVKLRSEKSWQFGGLVEKDYDHPVTISPVRMAHILSSIDARKSGKREPAIPTDMLFSIGEGMSRAFARAGAEQEVVVMAIKRERRFGIFDHNYLTSLVAYVKGPQLFIHLGRLDWEVPEKQEEKPPEPKIGEHRMDFRVYPSEGMELVDKQSVAVIWRDEVFARAQRIKVLPTGKVVRKSILLESDVDEPPPDQAGDGAAERAPAPSVPSGLSPEQLRALADLEEARRGGEITEAEYTARQQEILAGTVPLTRKPSPESE